MIIHVCPLSRVEETVTRTGARRLLSLLAAGTEMTRPAAIKADDHLHLSMHDIAEAQEGMTLPGEAHVLKVLDFAETWDRARPLVVNCYAGISRSTASAFAAACALNPHRDEMSIARQIRQASPTAYPNRLIVSLADRALGRGGRMLRALDAIGPGNMSIEGQPFRVDLE